ncbi:MAG: YsnF/AvaK domain-containing protein [Paracoccus sp. (in: a-proteobacteria)]|nr:YsnF/AvaK domain-containing protein [Paracoccus sp. (in: a-proteobacteria)]
MTYETDAHLGHAGHGRTLTAMFDSRDQADRAVQELRQLGVTDVQLHGQDNPGYGQMRHQEHEQRGFFDALGDFFFPDEDRAAYAEGLSRGGYLVTARDVPDHLIGQASDILDRDGSVDLETRETEWRDSGWDRAAYHGDAPVRDGTVEVVEEQVRIGKRDVDHGTVRVRSYVRETPVREDVELTHQRVQVERRPVDRPAGQGAFTDQVIEARAYGEEAVVQKEARVVEEIELNTVTETHTETVEDTVRKTEVEIEEDAARRHPDGKPLV